ncbi:MAG: hypothetical protein WA581_10475 [Candidatus Acidiferrales bacterium]
MNSKKLARLGVFAGMAIAAAATPAYSQTPSASCSTSQSAAVECFVASAVETQLLTLHDGMNLSQFQAYGVAVSKILQQQQTYVVLGAMASAIADAMPPTDANGESDPGAQRTANESIVVAEIQNGIVTSPADATPLQMVYFSQDIINAMNQNTGLSLSPGILLRIIDSYVVTATSDGTVNWTQVNSSLSSMLTNLIGTDVVKLPASITRAQVQKFIGQLAQIIYNYCKQTGRSSL